MPDLRAALAGVRVLDFSQGIAAPHGGCLLAEMGADVIKIEPPGGDWLRGLGVRRGDSSVLFGTFNRGKRGLALDLKHPEGLASARRLIAGADVMLESNRPGVMQRLGLDYETVRGLNPGLIYASVTGFGQSGPYRDRPATDAAVQAYTGFSFGAGDMVEPIRVRISMVDVVTGVYLSNAIVAALFQRMRTGSGQYLDISLMHAITAVQGYKYAEHQATAGALRRELFAAIGIYRTADGYIALSAMRDQQVTDLMALIGSAEVLDDPRFASAAARFENQDGLRTLIAARLAEQPSDHWLPKMRAIDLICQEVLNYDAYRVDPQVLQARLFEEMPMGPAGTLPTVRMPGLMPADGPLQSAAPGIGQHTVAILREAGFDEAALAQLRTAGVVVQGPHQEGS